MHAAGYLHLQALGSKNDFSFQTFPYLQSPDTMSSQLGLIIVITGATGAQGGAVIDTLLSSPPFPVHIRGTTRNVSSSASQSLIARGIEMVQADFNDPSSLSTAFAGAWAIFAVTDFWERFSQDPSDSFGALEQDFEHGVNLARAAARVKSLQHYIWSTEPHSLRLSQGKHLVPHFDGKARVDELIRREFRDSLYLKTTFLWVSFYAKNLQYLPMWKPSFDVSGSHAYAECPGLTIPQDESGKYSVGVPVSPDTKFASLGSLRNVGLAVAAIVDGKGQLECSSATLRSEHHARYIPVNNGFFTLKSYYEIWAKVALRESKTMSGKGDGTAIMANGGEHLVSQEAPHSEHRHATVEVRKIDSVEYEKLYGGFGKEMRAMFEFWRDMGEASWSVAAHSDDQSVVISLQELLGARGQQAVDLEDSFRELTWVYP
jgi:hypothetical protein